MGDTAEACGGPPPCLSAVCACAGGGLSGLAISVIPPTCIPFIEPCSNSADLCSQCYSESGCANPNSKSGANKTEMTCERKSRDGPITCRPGDHRP